MAAKKVVILGSTGSIGINTLKVIERFAGKFTVVGLTAYNNLGLLEKQIRTFKPAYVAVRKEYIPRLQRRMAGRSIKIFDVEREVSRIVTLPAVDIVVVGIRGTAALIPFLSAVKCGKTVAPANKEALVMAGHIIMAAAKKHRARIVPIDSEQSAIFQCLNGHNRCEVKKVYLTASGGPLRTVDKKRFKTLSVKRVLRHPRWKMGKKITVDSATLMNKGLEVIEAQRLFGLPVTDIEVLIHPEAIVHSMVEFTDGSIMAQLGATDMRLPIQYALTYPARWQAPLKRLDIAGMRQLTFEKPDMKKFPALRLCMRAARTGGTVPCVLNAANEEAVDAFLNRHIRFTRIPAIVERVIHKHRVVKNPKLKDIWKADAWARREAQQLIARS